jgi:hypothetical protein
MTTLFYSTRCGLSLEVKRRFEKVAADTNAKILVINVDKSTDSSVKSLTVPTIVSEIGSTLAVVSQDVLVTEEELKLIFLKEDNDA